MSIEFIMSLSEFNESKKPRNAVTVPLIQDAFQSKQ